MLCKKCGHDTNDDFTTCPECGEAAVPDENSTNEQSTAPQQEEQAEALPQSEAAPDESTPSAQDSTSEQEDSTQSDAYTAPFTYDVVNQEPPQKAEKSKKGIIIAICAALAILIGAGSVFAFVIAPVETKILFSSAKEYALGLEEKNALEMPAGEVQNSNMLDFTAGTAEFNMKYSDKLTLETDQSTSISFSGDYDQSDFYVNGTLNVETAGQAGEIALKSDGKIILISSDELGGSIYMDMSELGEIDETFNALTALEVPEFDLNADVLADLKERYIDKAVFGNISEDSFKYTRKVVFQSRELSRVAVTIDKDTAQTITHAIAAELKEDEFVAKLGDYFDEYDSILSSLQNADLLDGLEAPSELDSFIEKMANADFSEYDFELTYNIYFDKNEQVLFREVDYVDNANENKSINICLQTEGNVTKLNVLSKIKEFEIKHEADKKDSSAGKMTMLYTEKDATEEGDENVTATVNYKETDDGVQINGEMLIKRAGEADSTAKFDVSFNGTNASANIEMTITDMEMQLDFKVTANDEIEKTPIDTTGAMTFEEFYTNLFAQIYSFTGPSGYNFGGNNIDDFLPDFSAGDAFNNSNGIDDYFSSFDYDFSGYNFS